MASLKTFNTIKVAIGIYRDMVEKSSLMVFIPTIILSSTLATPSNIDVNKNQIPQIENL